MTSQPLQYADMVKEVGRTVRDVSRRKKNVIITGLSENATKEKDTQCILDIAYEIFNLDLTSHIVSCKRIGKVVSTRPRWLLVVLDSETAAENLLHCAPMLRDSGNAYLSNNVYINRDLTPEEATEAYMRRQERREARAEPTVGVNKGQNNAGLEPQQRDRRDRPKVYHRTRSTGEGSGMSVQPPTLTLSNRYSALQEDIVNADMSNADNGIADMSNVGKFNAGKSNANKCNADKSYTDNSNADKSNAGKSIGDKNNVDTRTADMSNADMGLVCAESGPASTVYPRPSVSELPRSDGRPMPQLSKQN
jgi:hypothetical protein